MRLLLALASLALAAPLPAAAQESVPPSGAMGPYSPACTKAYRAKPVAEPDGADPLRPLADNPAANHERAVDRRVNGCPVPVIIAYGVDRRPGEPTPAPLASPPRRP